MNFETFLQVTPEFSDFTNEELTLLDKSMRVDEYSADHVFIEEGAHGEEIYFIIDGIVSVSHKRGKKNGWLEIERLQPGEWFGLVSVLEAGVHKATYTAVTKVTIASLPKAAFNLLYNSNLELALKIQNLITYQVIRDHRALLSLIRKTMSALESTDDKKKILEMFYKQYLGSDRRAHEERRVETN